MSDEIESKLAVAEENAWQAGRKAGLRENAAELSQAHMVCDDALRDAADLREKFEQQAAELERLRADNAAMEEHYINNQAALGLLLNESQTELEALRKDAERYRTLREQFWMTSNLFVVAGGKARVVLGTDCPSLDRLDAMIDAMKGSK
jgi:predicted nuclease with TOPRIM domain